MNLPVDLHKGPVLPHSRCLVAVPHSSEEAGSLWALPRHSLGLDNFSDDQALSAGQLDSLSKGGTQGIATTTSWLCIDTPSASAAYGLQN